MRLFTGVFPPAEIQRDVGRAAAQTRSLTRVRWIAPENLHVTLVFLGEVPDATDRAAAERALREAAGSVPPFPIQLRGLHAFPSPRRARVLVLRVGEGGETLTRLHAALARALPPQLRPDPRRFVPHLTLARLKAPPPAAAVGALATELEDLRWRFPVQTAQLVRSERTPAGSHYQVVADAPLAG